MRDLVIISGNFIIQASRVYRRGTRVLLRGNSGGHRIHLKSLNLCNVLLCHKCHLVCLNEIVEYGVGNFCTEPDRQELSAAHSGRRRFQYRRVLSQYRRYILGLWTWFAEGGRRV